MKALLFDLDGTLVNSLEDIRRALNHVLKMCYASEIDSSQCMSVVGHGLRKALRDALWFSRAAYPEDEFEILYSELMDYYSAHACDYSRPYDGVTAFLERAKGRGCFLGVLSNKSDELVKKITGQLFPASLFDFVRGLREGEKPKPDNNGVLDYAKLCNVSLDDVTMIGDSDVDYLTARNAGVKSIIVSYGFRSEAELRAAGISPVVPDMEEVEKLLWN